MTVEGEHVYHVSTLGVLAHNNNCAVPTPTTHAVDTGHYPKTPGTGVVDTGHYPSVTPRTAVPTKATDTLEHVRKTGRAPTGHRGGRRFANDGRGGGDVLPRIAPTGNPVSYREYDVNPYRRGVNRGAERLVVGDDGRAYYTGDHYRTFTEIIP